MPPKGRRNDATEDAFLFVNEDFSTLFGGSKNTDLDRSKQSHVQRQSFAKRRKIRRKGDQTSSAVSPASSEGVYSPLTGNELPVPGSRSRDRVSSPHLLPPENAWLPTVSDQAAGERAPHIAPAESFDEFQISQWEPSASQPAYFEPLPSPLESNTSSGILQFDPTFELSLNVAEQISREGSNEIERESLSPLISVSSNDPFHDIQTALESWAPAIMSYFTTIVVPELFHTDVRAASLRSMRHVEDLHEDMRSCMRDPAEMYALLAANSWDAIEREENFHLPGLDPKEYDRVPLLFNSKAFEALRLRLSRGELSHSIVIAIQRMICAALYTSSFEAIEAHYRAQLSMIRSLGGLETFNDFQKERLIIHDFSYAVNTRSLPRMELSWDPGEISAELNLESVIYLNQQKFSDAGSRFRDITEESQLPLHPVVMQSIPQLMETQQILEWLRAGPYRPAEYRWLTQRRLAILHRLLSIDNIESANPLRMVRLALFQYCVLVRAFPRVEAPLIDRYVVPEIRSWEVDAILDEFGRYKDLLLWVMVMLGIGIAKRRAQLSLPERTRSSILLRSGGWSYSLTDTEYGSAAQTVTKVIKTVCRRLDIETEVHLRRYLRMFLVDDDFWDDSCTTFVREELQLPG